MFRARLRARLCRGKEGLHRAPTFVRQFGGYTYYLLLFLSSTHYCPLFHPLLTTLRPSKGGLKRQSLLQTWCGSARPGVGLRDLVWVCATWCGSAPRRGPSANGYDAWRFGSCGPGRKILAAAAADLVWVCAPPRTIRKWLRRLVFWILRTRAQDPCSCCLIFRTKVDEKVDDSGWRIKIVADSGYTHQIVRQKWVPGGALLSRGTLIAMQGHQKNKQTKHCNTTKTSQKQCST